MVVRLALQIRLVQQQSTTLIEDNVIERFVVVRSARADSHVQITLHQFMHEAVIAQTRRLGFVLALASLMCSRRTLVQY